MSLAIIRGLAETLDIPLNVLARDYSLKAKKRPSRKKSKKAA